MLSIGVASRRRLPVPVVRSGRARRCSGWLTPDGRMPVERIVPLGEGVRESIRCFVRRTGSLSSSTSR